MDLNTLATNLRAQASVNHAIVLDDSVFPSATLGGIRTSFALPPGTNLTIAGVEPTDIPDPTADGLLTISRGTAAVLNQNGVGVVLTFTASAGNLQVVILAKMAESWSFMDSWSGLDVFPFQTIATPNATFVYTSAEQPSYP